MRRIFWSLLQRRPPAVWCPTERTCPPARPAIPVGSRPQRRPQFREAAPFPRRAAPRRPARLRGQRLSPALEMNLLRKGSWPTRDGRSAYGRGSPRAGHGLLHGTSGGSRGKSSGDRPRLRIARSRCQTNLRGCRRSEEIPMCGLSAKVPTASPIAARLEQVLWSARSGSSARHA